MLHRLGLEDQLDRLLDPAAAMTAAMTADQRQPWGSGVARRWAAAFVLVGDGPWAVETPGECW